MISKISHPPGFNLWTIHPYRVAVPTELTRSADSLYKQLFYSTLQMPCGGFFPQALAAQRGLWPPRITRFLDHTQRRATVGRTPLEE
jgi:hypothetical protein